MSKTNPSQAHAAGSSPVPDFVRAEFEQEYATEDPFHRESFRQELLSRAAPDSSPSETVTTQSSDAVPQTMEGGLMLLAIYRAAQDGSVLGLTSRDGRAFSARVVCSGSELDDLDFAEDDEDAFVGEAFRGADWSEGESEFGFVDADTGEPLGFTLTDLAWVSAEVEESIGGSGDLLRAPEPGIIAPPTPADLAVWNLHTFVRTKESCRLLFVNDSFPSGIALQGTVLRYNSLKNAGVFQSEHYGRIGFSLDRTEVEVVALAPADALQLNLPVRETFAPDKVKRMSPDELIQAAESSGGIALHAKLYVAGINEVLHGDLALANLRGRTGDQKPDDAHRSRFRRLMGSLRDDDAKGVWFLDPITERSVWIPLEQVYRIEFAERHVRQFPAQA
jgi:hypothetical protein